MKRLLLDTNIFLHFKLIEEIDWCSIVDDERVELIISHVLLRELSEAKDLHRHKKIRSRAQTAIRILNSLLNHERSMEIRKGVVVVFLESEPEVDYQSKKLNEKLDDDQFLAHMFEDSNVGLIIDALCTDDISLKAKCRARKFGLVELPQSEKLPEPADEHDKELLRLKRENADLKSVSPDLQLSFEDGEAELKPHLSVQKKEHISQDKAAKQAEELCPPYEPRQGGAINAFVREMHGLSQICPDDVQRFNKDRERFIKDFALFPEKMARYEYMKSLRFSFVLYLNNRGGSPAENIDVKLHFPDGFELLSQDQLPREPFQPRVPVKPRTHVDLLGDRVSSVSRNPLLMNRSFIPEVPGNISKPDIKITNSYDVNFVIRKVKHHETESLHELYVQYREPDEVKPFEINYFLLADNHPQPFSGRLLIKPAILSEKKG